ncbi:MAG: hypothetical protein RL719_982 [Actinomycetota bacterium]
MDHFFERAWRYILRRGKVRRVTLKLNKWSEALMLLGPKEISPQLARRLELGEPLDTALINHVREAYKKVQRINTRAMLQRIYDSESTRVAGALAFGVFLACDNLPEAAFGYFKEAGMKLSAQKAPYEFFDAWIKADPKKALRELDSLMNDESVSSDYKIELTRAAIKHKHTAKIRQWVASIDADAAAKKKREAAKADELAWWVKMLADDGSDVKDIPGAINFAVMDYDMLDKEHTSSNRGDYVQTLAAISHLLRFQNIEFVGGSKLASYLKTLQPRIQKHRQLTGAPVKVQPIELNRDFASGKSYPKNTWLISNGWFMHRAYKGEIDFPYPENVNPIMISFHIQDAGIMNEEIAAQLKKLGPIGCRDWTTVYRLRDYGVPAFFSGCVTTTVGQVLPKAWGAGKMPLLAVVEAGRKWLKAKWLFIPKWFYIQIGDYVKDFTLVEGIEDARGMLAKYAKFGHVLTKRLHCYLPARSMGQKVTFVPGKRSDVRFEGLLDLNEADFNKIRTGIENKLEIIIGEILAGKSREDVMKKWREIVADDVAFAEQYCTNLAPLGESAIDLKDVYKKFKSHVVKLGNNKRGARAVNVAFACDQNLANELAIVIASVQKNTKRELNVHLLSRGLKDDYYQKLHKLFPKINFSFYDFDEIQYGSKVNLMKHITVSTFDRLFLPMVLTDLDKVLYLDVDILVRGDVGQLYDTRLGNKRFAGKRSRMDGWANLVDVITRVSLLLPPQQAWNLRRRAHATGDLTADTYNAGILLMNLKRMREESFIEKNLYLVEELRLNDQDVMNFYAGGEAIAIDDDWNYVPTQDYSTDPKIVHWAGPSKPWKAAYALYKPEFVAIGEELKSK